MGRAAVYLDGGHVDEGLGPRDGLTIDFESLSDAARAEGRRFRTYYDRPPWPDDPSTEDQRERLSGYHGFRGALRELRGILRDAVVDLDDLAGERSRVRGRLLGILFPEG